MSPARDSAGAPGGRGAGAGGRAGAGAGAGGRAGAGADAGGPGGRGRGAGSGAGGSGSRAGGQAPPGPVPTTLVRMTGEDASVLDGVVRTIVESQLAGADRSLALEDLGGDDVTPSAVVDACQTPPFLSDRRVIVVRDVGRWSSDDVEQLLSYIADPSPTASLILVGAGKLSQKLVNAVKKYGTIVDATVPAGRGRTTWLVDQLRAGSVVFDAAAASRLEEHIGEDVGRLSGLLDVLAAAYGEGGRIGVAELEPFLGEAGGVAPWDLTDAIDKGDTEGALIALHRLLGAGDRHPLALLSTLHRHYGAMLRLDGAQVSTDAEAGALVGMAPYPASKARTVGRRLGSANVGRAITLLADADLDLRGLKDWPDGLVMDILVARLSRLAGRAGARSGRR